MNPVPEARSLTLNVSEVDNAIDLDLARSVAPYFRIAARDANEIITRSRAVVRQWRTIAGELPVSAREREHMADAFRLAD